VTPRSLWIAFVPASALVLSAAGCVPKTRYDLAVKSGAESERAAETARTEATELAAKLENANKDNGEKSARLVTYEQQTYEDSRRLADLEKRLTDLGATHNEVGERLRLASKSLTELATERRTLTLAVADARACLDALASARSRAAQTQTAQAPPPSKGVAKSAAAPLTSTAPPELLDFERCVQKALAPSAQATVPSSGPGSPVR